MLQDDFAEDGEIEGEVGDDPTATGFDDGDVKAKLRRLDAAINGSPSASERASKRQATSPLGVASKPFRNKKEEKQWKRSQQQAAQAVPATTQQLPGPTPGYFDVYGPNVSTASLQTH